MNENIYIMTKDGELYHYGVLGMKWGVRKANYYSSRRDRLEKKAAKYDVKAAKKSRKADKLHAEEIENRSQRTIKRAAKFKVKAAKLMKKSVNTSDEMRKLTLEAKSAKQQLKADKIARKAESYKRTTPYGAKAESKAQKADHYTYKAAKVKAKIANDKRYIAIMNQRVSSLTEAQRNGEYKFVESLLKT